MTNSDHDEGRIFLSNHHTNNGFFVLLTIKIRIFIFSKKLPELPEYAELLRKMMASL